MTTQHTPGPWKHIAGGEVWAGHRRITLGKGSYDEQDAKVRNANAQLIAAAPDLLDALAEIANLLATHPDVEIGNSKIHYAMHKARNAIAIATSL